MNKIIIGLVGQAGSGKGTAANILYQRHAARVFTFSDILKDILERLYLDASRDNLINLSIALRQSMGQDILSNTMEKQVDKTDSPLVVVDGIRRVDDIKDLKNLPGFMLVHIVADPKSRYERLKARNEKPGESQMTWEDFLAMSERETEKSIAEVAKLAVITIENNSDIPAFEKELEKLVQTN